MAIAQSAVVLPCQLVHSGLNLTDEDMSVESGKRPPNGHDHKTKPPKPPRQAGHIDGITPDDAAKEN